MKNKMFLDMELNEKVTISNRKEIFEIIQIAYIIYSEDVNQSKEIYRYQTYVKPSIRTKLTYTIRDLTKITQEDVDNGVSLYGSIEHLLSDVKKYNVSKIYTWGKDDVKVLSKNMDTIRSEVTNKDFGILLSRFFDLSEKISSLYSSTAISLSDMCALYGISTEGHHNAMNDAQMLLNVYLKYKVCLRNDFLQKTYVDSYKHYLDEKEIYHNLKFAIKKSLKLGIDYNALIKKIIENADCSYHRFLSYEKWNKTSTNKWCNSNMDKIIDNDYVEVANYVS